MPYDPKLHHRHSLRLQEYDYSRAGFYFITICTQERACLFGTIENGNMTLNDAGHMVNQWWNELRIKYPNIELHEHFIMPNHIHGIMQIHGSSVGAHLRVGPGQTHGSAHTKIPLQTMVQWFRTMTTNEYIRGVKNKNWPWFNKKLWQRNYYEHVIRDEKSYIEISEYIQTNPLQWHLDRYYAQ